MAAKKSGQTLAQKLREANETVKFLQEQVQNAQQQVQYQQQQFRTILQGEEMAMARSRTRSLETIADALYAMNREEVDVLREEQRAKEEEARAAIEAEAREAEAKDAEALAKAESEAEDDGVPTTEEE